jgi:hypothetical protein
LSKNIGKIVPALKNFSTGYGIEFGDKQVNISVVFLEIFFKKGRFPQKLNIRSMAEKLILGYLNMNTNGQSR